MENQQTIFAVDDEPSVLSMMERYFVRAGFNFKSAENAEDALEILRADKDIQVMFFDIRLPAMDGIELCRIIRQEKPDAAIFALTGYANLQHEEMCHEAGFDRCFTKPTPMSELLKAAKDGFKNMKP